MDLLMPVDDFSAREERIIQAAVERALLMMPEAIEHLILQKTITKKIAEEFFKENKDFSAHLDLMQEIIEKTEMDNPGVNYGKIIELATPAIRTKLQTLSKMNYQKVDRPDTHLGESPSSDFGAI
jgi:hypothetical protein